CAGRKKVIRECKNPIAEGNFQWIFASCWSRSEQQLWRIIQVEIALEECFQSYFYVVQFMEVFCA
ncbi:MAG: hypothetical protein K2G19_01670, partial [Lachnospiraceae bacterium]|nr:hypothetical protein [Lachnospiraceae bacterium]